MKAALSLNGSGTSVADLVSSLAGTGSADIENFAINGLDQNAFPGMLTAADAMGDQPAGASQPDAKQFAAIADKAVGQGHFVAGNPRFDFTVAGVLHDWHRLVSVQATRYWQGICSWISHTASERRGQFLFQPS